MYKIETSLGDMYLKFTGNLVDMCLDYHSIETVFEPEDIHKLKRLYKLESVVFGIAQIKC